MVGILTLNLFIPACGSLAEKRRVVSSIKERVRSRFNVSVAEVAEQDIWQRAVLGVAVVSPDRRHADEVLQKVLAAVDSWALAEVSSSEIEIL